MSNQTTNVVPAGPLAAVEVLASGRVQGVGFRPFVARLASRLSLAGQICNTGRGVAMTLEGTPAAIQCFLERMSQEAPSLARIETVEVHEVETADRKGIEITTRAENHPPHTPIPRDLKVCHECLLDVEEPNNRRADYGLASCSNCGPRYTLIASLPYRRSATAMGSFEMCPHCRKEFDQPADRRFHAETIACWECGPQYGLATASGRTVASGRDAIQAAQKALRSGQIVALCGVGGYQLLCDATNGTTVEKLRTRKRRPAKPLAVLVASLPAAKRLASLCPVAEQALVDPAGPIVVAPAKADSPLDSRIHPGLTEVGVLLPTSPLHWLLARECPPLVATSGNMEGQPLEYTTDSARQNLAHVADFFLEHNRPIYRPMDDSVVKVIAGKLVTMRAARGIAPLPLNGKVLSPKLIPQSVIALGGQQNNALALWNGRQAVLGPHVGDLEDLSTRERWNRCRVDFCQLLGADPSFVVHDLHSDYYATRWAAESGLPAMAVQHHHAHAAAVMLENAWLDREVLAIAWDGTGLGPEGAIWGGEFLRATALDYERVARLRPLTLPGGERAIREPWRVALALLAEAIGAVRAVRFLSNRGWDAERLSQLITIVERPRLSPQTSSMGRLFDGVSTIALPYEVTAGGCSQFEGQLAMLLESWCDWSRGMVAEERVPYCLPIHEQGPGKADELDWRPLIAAVVADCEQGLAPIAIARRFHGALAKCIGAVSDRHAHLPVALCGGVFQNRVVTEMTVQEFSKRSQPLALPGEIPPGDGGLAAGQLVVALARLGRGHHGF